MADCFLHSFVGVRVHDVSLGCARIKLKIVTMTGVSLLSGLLSHSGGCTQRCNVFGLGDMDLGNHGLLQWIDAASGYGRAPLNLSVC